MYALLNLLAKSTVRLICIFTLEFIHLFGVMDN